MGLSFEVDAWGADAWDGMAEGFGQASFYQSWHYGKLHARGPFRRASRAVLSVDGKCVVMAQFQLKRLPLGPGVAESYWGPVFDPATLTDRPQLLREFLARAKQEYVGRRGLDLRFTPRGTLSAQNDAILRDVLVESGFRHNDGARPYKTSVLDVTRELAVIRKALDQKWRNQLNVAEKAGMTLEVGQSPEMFDRFYKLYEEMWAKKRFGTGVRVPVIRKIHSALPAGRGLRITIAKDGEQDVGATVCAVCGDTLLYFLGATSSELRSNSRPGYLMQWSHITFAKEAGLKWYDTGGIPDDAPDIVRFKTRMNGTIVEFPGLFEAPSGAGSSRLYSIAEKGYRRLRRLTVGR
jgi:lipid II:glycine glycyltransferase (peptidoglycan interpeptide bridge formation enzyme)